MEDQQPFPASEPPPPAPAFEPTYQPTYAPTNTLAIVSLVLGIGSFVLALGPLASVPGIITAYIARGQIAQRGEGGAQLALWGLVLGYINVGLAALTLIGGVLAAIAFAVTHH
jgi:hypothetical protein